MYTVPYWLLSLLSARMSEVGRELVLAYHTYNIALSESGFGDDPSTFKSSGKQHKERRRVESGERCVRNGDISWGCSENPLLYIEDKGIFDMEKLFSGFDKK